MYLDDGVSRSSAPIGLPQYGSDDSEAKGEYREVKISHVGRLLEDSSIFSHESDS